MESSFYAFSCAFFGQLIHSFIPWALLACIFGLCVALLLMIKVKSIVHHMGEEPLYKTTVNHCISQGNEILSLILTPASPSLLLRFFSEDESNGQHETKATCKVWT